MDRLATKSMFDQWLAREDVGSANNAGKDGNPVLDSADTQEATPSSSMLSRQTAYLSWLADSAQTSESENAALRSNKSAEVDAGLAAGAALLILRSDESDELEDSEQEDQDHRED
jgi:hypothetical protein